MVPLESDLPALYLADFGENVHSEVMGLEEVEEMAVAFHWLDPASQVED